VAARLDLARSRGLTGWNTERDQAYLHTDGTPVVQLALSPAPVTFPRLVSSSGEITFQHRSDTAFTFIATDLREIVTVFAGLIPSAPLRATVNGTAQSLRAAADGTLTLKLPLRAEVSLDFSFVGVAP
jgi:hypothetical protein